ncbi:hypothetical protein K432DRAFT_380008 [Lepidopterella palustris CBS 459.81]|uniref:INO80 complex subunit F domain-containing protein n=1 Tax=Lepidopterella palustris CBS 459.81 TaxID=1314670 RepID=A0A8E2JHM1_9PEZI|nr:hypothetical protein K432DRAFT_380008 [Lepidopterella palustris CBS 459.81]
MPQSGRTATSHKDLPPSVELAYYRKCIELRRRINDIEENNDATRLRIKRLNRAVTKMRLERAFLLEQLAQRMEYNVDESDRSSSPPPTPQDKPLRSKRSHRKTTPTAGGHQSGSVAAQHPSPPSTTQQQQQSIQHSLQPLSSTHSTPDPGRSGPIFFGNTPGAATSPHGVNGTGGASLPPIQSHLPPLHPQRQHHGQGLPAQGGAYFDGPYEERRSLENEAEYAGSSSGRRRAYSSGHGAHSEHLEGANGEARGQDTEMGEAPPAAEGGAFSGGFTAVNR